MGALAFEAQSLHYQKSWEHLRGLGEFFFLFSGQVKPTAGNPARQMFSLAQAQLLLHDMVGKRAEYWQFFPPAADITGLKGRQVENCPIMPFVR